MAPRAERYWKYFDARFAALGYADYLGALEELRAENPADRQGWEFSFFFMDFEFSRILYPGALAVLERFATWGPTVILSDGDAVFQPHKIRNSGLWKAVDGRVLIYIHKEKQLANVVECYPADHYVLVNDKLRILTAAKKAWGKRVTTVFPRQGHYAHDPKILAENPAADVTVEHIGELDRYDLAALVAAAG